MVSNRKVYGLRGVLATAIVGLLLLMLLTNTTSHEQIPTCSHFVDNNVSRDGDGSESWPWDNVAGHVNDLSPGNVMCIRGDVTGPGRVYVTGQIELNQDGTAERPITIRSYPGEKVVLRKTGTRYLVYLKGSHWVLEGLTLDHDASFYWAVVFRGDSNHNVLRNNEIHNGQSNGVVITRGSTDNVIEKNHIHNFSDPHPPKDADCVMVQVQADNTIISHNIIHDCSGDGVQLIGDPGDDPSNNVRITNNTFYRGTIPRAESAVSVKVGTNFTVANNTMSGYFDANAVTMAKVTTNGLFENNIIHDSLRGFNIHSRTASFHENLVIRNNLIYNITEYAIQFSRTKNATFVHNTIVNAQRYALRVIAPGFIGGLVQNNLFVNSGRAQLKDGAVFRNVTVGYNGWFDTEADSIFADHTDIVGSGDPGFVNVASHDYHLMASSPACNAGTDVGVMTDFEDDPRPFGSGFDIGADEYMPAGTPVYLPMIFLEAYPMGHD